MNEIRHIKDTDNPKGDASTRSFETFVLDKNIFSNIFEKDIRRVYIYKKSERLAKAIHLVTPAFENTPSLRDKMDSIAVGLIEAAIETPTQGKNGLSRELLALSSVLSIARTSGILSAMNAELIAREAHLLLQEIAMYEEPRIFLEESPTLASLAKDLTSGREGSRIEHKNLHTQINQESAKKTVSIEKKSGDIYKGHPIGHIKDTRKSAILDILKTKGPSYIKDISVLIRDISEKTIQRELQKLVESGEIERSGERRWTMYKIKG